MSKTSLIILVLVAVCLIFVFYYFHPFSKAQTIKIKLKNTTYSLEVAQTPNQQAKGLSKRDYLCPTCGMIFVFRKEGILPFWMKNTLIPLDMIWINNSSQIVYIQTAQPELKTFFTQLKIYQNQTPAKYVIELNANDTQKLNLKTGDTINLPNNL